jgi:hypothetical protein
MKSNIQHSQDLTIRCKAKLVRTALRVVLYVVVMVLQLVYCSHLIMSAITHLYWYHQAKQINSNNRFKCRIKRRKVQWK